MSTVRRMSTRDKDLLRRKQGIFKDYLNGLSLKDAEAVIEMVAEELRYNTVVQADYEPKTLVEE